MEYRLLQENEVDAAYSIIEQRVSELLANNINQYTEPFPPKEIFKERQKLGYNFALFDNTNIIGIYSLIPNYQQDEWASEISSTNFLWLSTLFISNKYKHKGFGKQILSHIEKYAQENSFQAIYLDCYIGNNYLPNFYMQNGYIKITSKKMVYTSRSFEAMLLSFTLPDNN